MSKRTRAKCRAYWANEYREPRLHNVSSSSVERFAAAVGVLVADGPIKQRLAAACSMHLADLTEADVPPALRRELAELQAAISRVAPAGHETPVRASVQKMSPREASAHAATIVKLYVALVSGVERAEP